MGAGLTRGPRPSPPPPPARRRSSPPERRGPSSRGLRWPCISRGPAGLRVRARVGARPLGVGRPRRVASQSTQLSDIRARSLAAQHGQCHGGVPGNAGLLALCPLCLGLMAEGAQRLRPPCSRVPPFSQKPEPSSQVCTCTHTGPRHFPGLVPAHTPLPQGGCLERPLAQGPSPLQTPGKIRSVTWTVPSRHGP